MISLCRYPAALVASNYRPISVYPQSFCPEQSLGSDELILSLDTVVQVFYIYNSFSLPDFLISSMVSSQREQSDISQVQYSRARKRSF
jgi:hypothetical protein